jgi:HK97 family phage major capsid protein
MEPTGQFHFRDLVRTIQSATDNVKFPRANIPIGDGSFSRVAETVTKPQVDRNYTMIDLVLNAMAGYAIVSRQSLRNIVFLQSWLPTSMMDQLQDNEDTDFSNSLVAAATGSTTLQTGFVGVPEKLISFMINLMKKKFRATAIACDPNIWGSLLVFQPGRTTTGSAATTVPYSNPLSVTVGQDGMVRILGIPVYPVNWLSGGRVIVGDWSKAAIVQSEGLVMRQSDSHASIFTANEIAFLLERTEGLAIFRPDAFISAILT